MYEPFDPNTPIGPDSKVAVMCTALGKFDCWTIQSRNDLLALQELVGPKPIFVLRSQQAQSYIASYDLVEGDGDVTSLAVGPYWSFAEAAAKLAEVSKLPNYAGGEVLLLQGG